MNWMRSWHNGRVFKTERRQLFLNWTPPGRASFPNVNVAVRMSPINSRKSTTPIPISTGWPPGKLQTPRESNFFPIKPVRVRLTTSMESRVQKSSSTSSSISGEPLNPTRNNHSQRCMKQPGKLSAKSQGWSKSIKISNREKQPQIYCRFSQKNWMGPNRMVTTPSLQQSMSCWKF